ncbi:MgtC/SapB family protein [Nitrosovibrio tenuis]|uniref:Protein MgtC n=1 Tax=Nitrosovibrio tenuis TaxID=1233 RepID=A0A1H7J029_9PROT|nr:MgtC/SapB family protein [Nitrosovibrio tenuis]SEK67986.1 putative Mg2+ transporter-C (MgtC) family protein [Nitrosovibrio tenuis]
MNADNLTVILHLVGAVVAGGFIGLERTFHGHPAGFRTHALVCLASSLLMLVALHEWRSLPGFSLDSMRTDPMRMAQGIMTGIGFLGAGVIFKEGLSVRGLTTAASIWITAAIGIMLGIGFYFPAVLGTVFTLGILSLFRVLEDRIPRQKYAQYHVSFDRNNVMSETLVRKLLTDHGFEIANMSYRITQAGLFEYRMDIRTTNADRTSALAEILRGTESVREFRISTTGS